MVYNSNLVMLSNVGGKNDFGLSTFMIVMIGLRNTLKKNNRYYDSTD